MGLTEAIQFFPKTDVGRVRDLNEDNFLVDKKLALTIVADGMGGHAAGEVASAIAVRVIHQEVRKRADIVKSLATGRVTRDAAREIQHMMESAVLRACSRVHEEAKSDTSKRGMGTTLSSLLVVGQHGFVAHVGDSRIYLYRDGKVQQITEDHTVYNELIRRGRLTREQIEKVAQKNAVTRAVGVYERVDVDTLMLDLLPGDQFLLASDGLHGYINHVAELEPYFEDEDGERASSELIELANKKGGKDNITCVIVRIGRPDQTTMERARRLEQKRQALRNMPLFSKLQERELLRIMQVAEVLEFEAGEDVVREGDRGDELFIVVEGMLNILRGEQILSEVGPGEHFGEMALIRSSPRSATVRATEHSELIALRRGDFFAILRKEYELAGKLLWQFLGVLADRLDQTSRDLSNAKEELAAEDISDAIAEDMEETVSSGIHSGLGSDPDLGDTGSLPSAETYAKKEPRDEGDEVTPAAPPVEPAPEPRTLRKPETSPEASSAATPTPSAAAEKPSNESASSPASKGGSGTWKALRPTASRPPAADTGSTPPPAPVAAAAAPSAAAAAAAAVPLNKTLPSASHAIQEEIRKRLAEREPPPVTTQAAPPNPDPSDGESGSGEGHTQT